MNSINYIVENFFMPRLEQHNDDAKDEKHLYTVYGIVTCLINLGEKVMLNNALKKI